MPRKPKQPDPFNRCSISDAFIKSCRCFNAENLEGAFKWAKEISRLAGTKYWLNPHESNYIDCVFRDWNPDPPDDSNDLDIHS